MKDLIESVKTLYMVGSIVLHCYICFHLYAYYCLCWYLCMLHSASETKTLHWIAVTLAAVGWFVAVRQCVSQHDHRCDCACLQFRTSAADQRGTLFSNCTIARRNTGRIETIIQHRGYPQMARFTILVRGRTAKTGIGCYTCFYTLLRSIARWRTTAKDRKPCLGVCFINKVVLWNLFKCPSTVIKS